MKHETFTEDRSREPRNGSDRFQARPRREVRSQRHDVRLEGIDDAVLPFVNLRTGTLKLGIAIPKAIRAKYFAYIHRGKPADETSNRHLRDVWRARMSVQAAHGLGLPDRTARAVYFDKVCDSRQVTGMREFEQLKEYVDGVVDKILMKERQEGRDPMQYLAKFMTMDEGAKLAAKRFAEQEENALRLAEMAEAANAAVPFYEQIPEAERESPREVAMSMRDEINDAAALWILEDDSVPLPLLPDLDFYRGDVDVEMQQAGDFLPPPVVPPVQAPVAPQPLVEVARPEAGGDAAVGAADRAFVPIVLFPPRFPRVRPQVEVAPVEPGPKKHLGPRQRAKARGEAVAPNVGSNARRKVKLRAARAAGIAEVAKDILQKRGDSPMAMMAPIFESEVRETAGVEVCAEVFSEQGSECYTLEPRAGCNYPRVRLLRRRMIMRRWDEVDDGASEVSSFALPPVWNADPQPDADDILISIGKAPDSRRDVTHRRRVPDDGPELPVETSLVAPREAAPVVEESSGCVYDHAWAIWLSVLAISRIVELIAYAFCCGLWTISEWCGETRVWGWFMAVLDFVGNHTWEPMWRFVCGWPQPPVTPEGYKGDLIFSTAVRVGGQGVRSSSDNVESYVQSMQRTAVNAQARNSQADPSDTYAVGVRAHMHADVLAEYAALTALRFTRWTRFMRLLRRFLIVSIIILATLPPVYMVMGEDEERRAPLLRTGDIYSYVVDVLLPVVAAAKAISWVRSWTPKVELRTLTFPLTETGWLDPAGVNLNDVATGAYRVNATTAATTCIGFGDVKKLGAHCKVECDVSAVCLSPESRGATLVGWSTSPAYVLRKCLCNAHNSLCNRHGSVQPPVTRDVNEVFQDFRDVIEWHSESYWTQSMLDFAVWLLKWPRGKQESILRSMRDEIEEPGKVKAMVKREVNHKVPSKARMIQFYWNLVTQALFGPQFYAAQKTLCSVFRSKRMRGNIDVTFASGMKADEIGAWMERVVQEGAVGFYERDGKNWDSSMQSQHAKFRQDIYRLFDAELGDFASQCDRVSGFAVFPGGTLRYKMKYTVKSGHNDTTLGNSLVNAAIAYAAFKRLGQRASILVAGDDLLVAYYSHVDVEQVIALEKEYGITPEARVFDDYEKVTFISGMFIGDGEQIGFVPLPGRLFARLWWTISPPAARKVDAFRRGVARGLDPVAGSIPVLRTLLQSFDSQGVAIASNKGKQFHGSAFRFREGIWRAMERRYGLTALELAECESWLEGLPAEPLLLKHPVLDRFMEVDLADIGERGQGVW